MIYVIKFSPTVTKVIAKYKKSNPLSYRKLVKVLDDIAEHPRSGIGHPEPLVGGGDVIYSRRISGKDRIIYEIHDDTITVMVIDVEGHYNDK